MSQEITTATTTTSQGIQWKNLCAWVESYPGGKVHAGIKLQSLLGGGGGNDDDDRGIVATQSIAQGELLIQLPRVVAIDGSAMPAEYNDSYKNEEPSWNEKTKGILTPPEEEQQPPQPQHNRQASPWLRCLAAFYLAKQQSHEQQQQRETVDSNNQSNSSSSNNISRQPYLDSLPKGYETVPLSWTEEQMNSFLAGTFFETATTTNTSTEMALAFTDTQSEKKVSALASSSPLPSSTTTSKSNAHGESLRILRERFQQQIRPYLEACQIVPPRTTKENNSAQNMTDDLEFQQFLVNSQCLSTRAFHIAVPDSHDSATNNNNNSTQQPSSTSIKDSKIQSTRNEGKEQYASGPFLLPVIDLLNHASSYSVSPKKCTTLQCTKDYFLMWAERPISVGEEICHSYGDELTIGQSLQTFGFVERFCMELLLTVVDTSNSTGTIASTQQQQERHRMTDMPNPTPVLIPKQLVLDACRDVINSGLPERLGQAMEEADMDDDVWAVTMDDEKKQFILGATAFLPDQLAITRQSPTTWSEPPPTTAVGVGAASTFVAKKTPGAAATSTSLSDELVTLACIPFLPASAYREVEQSLVGKEILNDYFLGNLVCTSLLNVIKSRSEMYKPIVWNGVVRENDRELLHELLQQTDDETTQNGVASPFVRKRAMYGLALRLDEKASLDSLKKEVLQLLEDIENDGDEDEENTETSYKRFKTI